MKRSVVTILFLSILVLTACTESGPRSSGATYVLLPHPDDEFQVWSQVEHRTGDYTVFILMTHGEESGYCDTAQGGGKRTPQCANERLKSWLGFFKQMGESDSSLPSDWDAEPVVVLGVGEPKTLLIREDDPETQDVSLEALAWVDKQGRGALIAFDMGDGNLTEEEATWAAHAVIDAPTGFGLEERLVKRVLGAYSYSNSYPGCMVYPHGDHLAVARAAVNGEYGAESQLYATCGSDPAIITDLAGQVSPESAQAAFGEGGVFPSNYGWLGPWRMQEKDQSELFHTHQHFSSLAP